MRLDGKSLDDISYIYLTESNYSRAVRAGNADQKFKI